MPLQIAGRWLAIDALGVIEIVGPCAVTKIPGTPRGVPGVVAFRGRAVLVLDVAAVIGAGEPLAPGEPRARTVMVQIGASTIALPADAVREVIDASDAHLAPAGADEPWAEARVTVFGELVPVLDISRAVPAIAPV